MPTPVVTLFSITKTWKQHECPSADDYKGWSLVICSTTGTRAGFPTWHKPRPERAHGYAEANLVEVSSSLKATEGWGRLKWVSREMGRADGWVPGHRSKKPYYATAQKRAIINNNSL